MKMLVRVWELELDILMGFSSLFWDDGRRDLAYGSLLDEDNIPLRLHQLSRFCLTCTLYDLEPFEDGHVRLEASSTAVTCVVSRSSLNLMKRFAGLRVPSRASSIMAVNVDASIGSSSSHGSSTVWQDRDVESMSFHRKILRTGSFRRPRSTVVPWLETF